MPRQPRRRLARALAGRCHTERVRHALALALAGGSLREVAQRVGLHPSTVHEALRRYGLVGEWKRARRERLQAQYGGRVPALWARLFAEGDDA